MPTEIAPIKLQNAAHACEKRQRNFVAARIMFVRQFVGQYYDQSHGNIGTEPLNLIFNAIRILLPNLVMNHPKHNVSSEYVSYRDYAEMLGLALDFNGKQINLRDVYRRWIVDAIFALGILKTGICDSGTAIHFDDQTIIDPGQIYTETVDFENLVYDPHLRGPLHDSSFLGDKSRAPRQNLLDSGLYRNEFIERLPCCTSNGGMKSVTEISRGLVRDETYLQEEVEITELWVPNAQAITTIPGSQHVVFDDYLRVSDYEGPDNGPYTFLSFTPPVPGNPMPVSAVGIWHDLHVMANRMAKKIMDQALRQKDLVTYRRAAADDAEELRDAGDGDAVATEDPEGVKVVSFGGQNVKNEGAVDRLTMWFNMMAANPQAVGGQTMGADSATEAGILQSNANIGLEDMKDAVYIGSAEEGRKRLFYIHTDPLITQVLAKRQMTPTPSGMQMQEVQVVLTPEARQGDWIDYACTIEPESMGRQDSATRLNKALDFAAKVLPAAATAATAMMQLGMPFNVQTYITRMAKEVGITWMDEVWFDPMFQQKMAMRVMQGPQMENSKGQPGAASPAALMQNGQPGNVGAGQMGAGEQMRSDQQMGAAESQGDLAIRPRY